MKQTKITVGIACLIMSSSFAALAGGPAPVVNTSDSHAWTIYMNFNGDLSKLAGKKNNPTGGTNNTAITLGGGVNVGIAAKLTRQVNAFAQVAVNQFTNSNDTENLNSGGYRLAAATRTVSSNFVTLDKAFVNWNSENGNYVVQAGDMGVLDMSTFVVSNLNAWNPSTAGFDTRSVIDVFGPSITNLLTQGSLLNPTDTFNMRGVGAGYHSGSIYATAMYSVELPDSVTTTTKNGFIGKESGKDIQAQVAWKTNNLVVSGSFLRGRDTGADQENTTAFDAQAAYRMGKFVFTGVLGRFNDKDLTPESKVTYFGAGASYNLDLFGFNHTFQVNWLRDNNGKPLITTYTKASNYVQVNDIVPIFNKHFNLIPYYVSDLKTATATKGKNTQYGILFQGLWSVNV